MTPSGANSDDDDDYSDRRRPNHFDSEYEDDDDVEDDEHMSSSRMTASDVVDPSDDSSPLNQHMSASQPVPYQTPVPTARMKTAASSGSGIVPVKSSSTIRIKPTSSMIPLPTAEVVGHRSQIFPDDDNVR
jgi:hypothetical protein